MTRKNSEKPCRATVIQFDAVNGHGFARTSSGREVYMNRADIAQVIEQPDGTYSFTRLCLAEDPRQPSKGDVMIVVLDGRPVRAGTRPRAEHWGFIPESKKPQPAAHALAQDRTSAKRSPRIVWRPQQQ